jgi:TPR repeat protein
MHYYRQKLYNQAFEIAESVAKLEEVETIAKVTDCLVFYVAKGIALGCFVYARCLYKGYGVEKNEEKAINWFKRAYKFDPETVARFQYDMKYTMILTLNRRLSRLALFPEGLSRLCFSFSHVLQN